jgi:hypothetical protein
MNTYVVIPGEERASARSEGREPNLKRSFVSRAGRPVGFIGAEPVKKLDSLPLASLGRE